MPDSKVMYAVVHIGGQQFKVSAGDVIVVDRVDAEEGKSISFEPLAVRTADGSFDADVAKHAKVKARVTEHVLGKKIKVFAEKDPAKLPWKTTVNGPPVAPITYTFPFKAGIPLRCVRTLAAVDAGAAAAKTSGWKTAWR